MPANCQQSFSEAYQVLLFSTIIGKVGRYDGKNILKVMVRIGMVRRKKG